MPPCHTGLLSHYAHGITRAHVSFVAIHLVYGSACINDQELGASLWAVIDRKKLCAVRTVCPISGLVVTPNARKMMTE